MPAGQSVWLSWLCGSISASERTVNTNKQQVSAGFNIYSDKDNMYNMYNRLYKK